MDEAKARTPRTRARPATASSATAARWYARYLVVYGVASFCLAAGYGFFERPALAAAISMPLWATIIVGLSVWASRQRTPVGGNASIHGTVIAVWAAAWAATIGLGTTVFAGSWPWFLGGGAAMAGTVFCGAYATHRRSRA